MRSSFPMPARIAAWIANMAWQFQCFDSIRNCLKAFLIIFTGSITILTPLLAAEVPYLLFSPCTLEEDPDQEFPLFSSCLKANALLSVEQRSNIETEKQPPTAASANGSFAASITRFLVLDFAGHARVTKDRLEENIVDKDINSERTLLQIGNSAIHRHRLFAGISRPPIGLDLNIESQYLDFDEYKYFYSSPQKIFGYSYDNRKDIVWTIAGSAVNQSTLEPSERVARLSMRLSYDFAALEGSRVIGTFSTTELIQRVGGISLLNINGRGDRTSFEW
ncbi:MAG: hypothetical protein NT027_15510, partial [Proteobacteria bacterium]|nr:hypothetical protein [Pseudomonadota bacterium]